MALLLSKLIANALKCSTYQQIRFLKYTPIDPKTKITIGHRMTQVIDHKRVIYARKQSLKEKYEMNKTKDRLMISCKNSQFNHYLGQYYGPKFSYRNYASCGWRNRNKGGDYFTINAFGRHPGLTDSKEPQTFTEFNTNENIIQTLENKLNIKNPTKIQAMSFEKIRQHLKHILIAAETGCGKTLTYAIPLIEEVIEFNKNASKINRGPNEPLCLIMVPTRELAFQAYLVFKNFINENLNFRVVLDLKHEMIKSMEEMANEKIDCKLYSSDGRPPDIVISMPSRIKKQFFHNQNYIVPTYLRKFVIDEANLLLDDSNSPYILKIMNCLNLNLKPLNKENNLSREAGNTQLLFVSATIPRDMKNILQDIVDVSTELDVVQTNTVNKLMLHVPQHFYRLSSVTKREKLIEILREYPNESVMIFSNKTDTAFYVSKFLEENGLRSCVFYSNLPDDVRDRQIKSFLTGECNIISCTDMASRGLDTLNVKHVINFEMPTFIADYVHRIGRVGRLSANVKGARVTNFVSKAFEVDTVWNIEHSIRTNGELTNLNANINRILMHTYKPKNNRPIVESNQKIGEEREEGDDDNDVQEREYEKN